MSDSSNLDPNLNKPAWLDEPRAREIMSTVRPVAEAFHEAGHTLFLVGGVVRDLSLGGEGSVTDLDLTTDAEPTTTRTLLAPLAQELWTQGEKFGTIGARVDQWIIEVTTHRGESYVSESRKPVVTFGTDLRTDLSRRDFTINAMALDTFTGELQDPFGGAADLDARVLRTPLDASISFTDDPLRMMRAARFIPRFNLGVDESITAAVLEHRDRLDIVSRERIHDELERLLALPDPASGLDFLADTGLLDRVVSDLTEPAPVVAGAVTQATSPVARRSVLAAHAADSAAIFSHLRYSTSDRRATQRLLTGYDTLRDETAASSTTRRLVASVGRDSMTDLFDGAHALGIEAGEWRAQLAQLEATEDLDDLGSPLTGGDILKTLDTPPGPLVGEYTRRLADHRLEHGPITPDEARALIHEWFAAGQDQNTDHR